MSDTTVVRRARLSNAEISRQTFEANKNPATARAYLAGLSYQDIAVITTDRANKADKYDSTNSLSGKFAEHSYGHLASDGNVKFQFNQFARPPKFKPGQIWALIVYYDFDEDGLPGTTPGAEEIAFIGFIGIDEVDPSEPQRGVLEVGLKIAANGFHEGDL